MEVRDVILPRNMQRSMASQAESERERRAKLISAEGELQVCGGLRGKLVPVYASLSVSSAVSQS